MGNYIGKSEKRVEDPRFIQGKGNYVANLSMPDMAHVAILRSPHAHANIKSINTVEKIIRIGADKVLINSNIFEKKLTNKIINLFGKQVLVGGIDLFFKDGEYRIYQKGKTLGSVR